MNLWSCVYLALFSCPSCLLCRLNPPAWRKRNWRWNKQLCITSCLRMWPTWIDLGTLNCECLQEKSWGQALLILLGQEASWRVISMSPALGFNAKRHPGRNYGDLSRLNGIHDGCLFHHLGGSCKPVRALAHMGVLCCQHCTRCSGHLGHW